MDGTSSFSCPHCRKKFASEENLAQHQERSTVCSALHAVNHTRKHGDLAAYVNVNFARNVRAKTAQKRAAAGHNYGANRVLVDVNVNTINANRPQKGATADQNDEENNQFDADSDESSMEDDDLVFGDDEEEDDYYNEEEDSEEDEDSVQNEDEPVPDTEILDNFREYVENAQKNYVPFPKEWKDALDLMFALRQSRASLDTYDTIMEWHLRATGKLHPHQKKSETPAFISREILFKKLRERYNMPLKSYSLQRTITLPSSKASANLVVNDVKMVMQHLLTDPRIQAKDYLFLGKTPSNPPLRT